MDRTAKQALLLRLLAWIDQRIAAQQDRFFHFLSADETHAVVDALATLQNLRLKIEAELDLNRLKQTIWF